MTVNPKPAHGTIIEVLTDTDPSDVWDPILGLHNGPNGPGIIPQLIQGRAHNSEDTFNSPSTVDKTPITSDIYYDSSDTIHQLLRDAARNATKITIREKLKDTGAEIYRCDVYVSLTFSNPVEGWVTGALVFTIDGGLTVS